MHEGIGAEEPRPNPLASLPPVCASSPIDRSLRTKPPATQAIHVYEWLLLVRVGWIINKTVLLRRWGVKHENLVLSNELIKGN